MKLSSMRLRQIINEEVATFRVRERTPFNEDDMNLFEPDPGDPDYKEPQGDSGDQFGNPQIASTVDAALDGIEKIHKELWGYEEIPREMLEALDKQMEIINQNWEALTGLSEANEGGEGVHDIFNLPEPEAVEPTGNPTEDALRQIVADSQAGKVDGIPVDMTTANMVLQIADALSPENREKFLAMPIAVMIDFTLNGPPSRN